MAAHPTWLTLVSETGIYLQNIPDLTTEVSYEDRLQCGGPGLQWFHRPMLWLVRWAVCNTQAGYGGNITIHFRGDSSFSMLPQNSQHLFPLQVLSNTWRRVMLSGGGTSSHWHMLKYISEVDVRENLSTVFRRKSPWLWSYWRTPQHHAAHMLLQVMGWTWIWFGKMKSVRIKQQSIQCGADDGGFKSDHISELPPPTLFSEPGWVWVCALRLNESLMWKYGAAPPQL